MYEAYVVEALLRAIRDTWRWLVRPLSSAGVVPGGVQVRNFPGRRRTFPFAEVDRFDWQERHRRQYGVLHLTDGRAVDVYRLARNRPGMVAQLNNALRPHLPA